KYFTAADLVVLPYLSATGSGIAQIALAFDRPQIVTRVGGLPDAVAEDKTGFIVPPADPEALAEAVDRFFTGHWGERMAPFFAEEKKRFSWSALVEVMGGLFRELRGEVERVG
ncbi:MAG: glycosyltransferase, partial [Candidatus Krumholzibacteriota bacterium]|nr:glycosyltransferase [Candidatus Krumholzibacteriota bacterium]